MTLRYKGFTLDTPRADVLDSLDYITTQPPYAFADSTRTDHINTIIADLKAIVQGSPTRLRKEDAAPALLSLKTLGKVPHGAGVLAAPDNLKTLLDLSELVSADEPAAWAEAWRTVANTLLQNDGARTTWISDAVGGGQHTAKLIATSGLEPERIFLLCRVLFLSSLSSVGPEGAYIKSLVNEFDIVSVIATRLDELAAAMTAGTKMSREATSDALKFIFNVLHLYPKISPDEDLISPNAVPTNEDAWDPKLDGILPPLLRLLTSSTPTAPSPLGAPTTHIIHALIAVPASPTLLPLWFEITPASVPTPDALTASGSQARSSLDGKDSKESPKDKSKPSRFDRALSVLSRGSSKSPQPARTPPPNDAFDHLRRLLDFTLAFYLPAASEPDDSKTRDRAGGDGALDDALAPLTVVIARLCKADARARARISGWLWPADLDRSTGAGALESRPDALGRCLRLLQSVYHSRTKDGVGEMLYAAADSDASVLTSQVGYGNVAGLLYAKGILSAPTPPAGSSSDPTSTPASSTPGPAINPITGVAFDPKSTLPEMTEEEKEREAEKLFVLFDRLERSGAIKPEQNPVRDAMRKANS